METKMIYSLEIRADIAATAASFKEIIPLEIKLAINLAKQDLYLGPVYLNASGELCDCFDDGATSFDFRGACNAIREWLNSNVSDIKIEIFYGGEEGASEYESVDGTAEAICKELLGEELFKKIY